MALQDYINQCKTAIASRRAQERVDELQRQAQYDALLADAAAEFEFEQSGARELT